VVSNAASSRGCKSRANESCVAGIAEPDFLPSLVFAKRSFLPSLVSQAEMGCAGRHRMRQLGTRRDQQRRMARHAPNIGPGKFLHGIDEQRQPAPFAVSRPPGLSRPRGLSPWLKFLTHRLSLPKPTPADRMPTRKSPIRSWRPAVKKTCKNPPKKPVRCDLLHKRLLGDAVNHRNGRENTPIIVRFPGRHRHRLCLDRHRGRCCPDRADLSHRDLNRRRAAA
jgi:hypothetical protein